MGANQIGLTKAAVGPVQLSILIPTNRRGLLVCSRIAQACSWAGPNIEVIIRDNSGDAEKRALLSHFQRDNCNIIVADPCEALTNVSEIIKIAKGEFIFLLADDDFSFDRAIAVLPAMLDRAGRDRSVAGVTGAYAVETSQGSITLSYQNVESDDLTQRVAGFLAYNGPNILQYAPVRRDVVQRVFDFMNTLPFYFSFHDQIVCLLYLLNGKFIRLNRFLYLYDVGPWEKTKSGQKRDIEFYAGAGLDPVINKLHWFLCGFEGAMLVRNMDLFPDYSLAVRQVVADRWFSAMFLRFKSHGRLTFDSKFAGDADKLCEKLRNSAGQLTFQDMLADISHFFSLFSKSHGQSYFGFWNAILGKRQPSQVPAAAGNR